MDGWMFGAAVTGITVQANAATEFDYLFITYYYYECRQTGTGLCRCRIWGNREEMEGPGKIWRSSGDREINKIRINVSACFLLARDTLQLTRPVLAQEM